MRNSWTAVAVALGVNALMCFASVAAPDTVRLSEEVVLAQTTLQGVETFAIGGTGPGGVMSKGEAAARVIMRDPDAVAIFRRLASSQATVAGKLYALTALHALDLRAFKKGARGLDRSGNVVWMSGCMGMMVSAEIVLGSIREGRYDDEIRRAPPDRHSSK